MQITIKTKNLELTPQLEAFVNKKMSGLKKFLGSFQNHNLPMAEGRGLFDTFVELKRETTHHRQGKIFTAEAKMYMPGKSLFAKANADDINKAIFQVREELAMEIRKYKSKVVEFPKRRAKQHKEEL